VGPGGAVFAFEPQPSQVSYLREVFGKMQYDNVSIVPMAVSNSVGEMELFVPPGRGFTHAASLERGAWGGSEERGARSERGASVEIVKVTTLDAFFGEQARRPGLIKIDVEGHELAVLEGARRTLAACRPRLLVECEQRHRPDGDVRPVFEFLESLGYEGSFFLGRRRRPLSEFDAALHQRIDDASHDLPKGYVNNFAFEARD